jgi:hypothetical protein
LPPDPRPPRAAPGYVHVFAGLAGVGAVLADRDSENLGLRERDAGLVDEPERQ